MLALLPGLLGSAASARAEARRGYHPKVAVSAPGRLDWTFVLGTRSLQEPPADWTPDYDAAKQHYELFVPPDHDPQKSCAAVLFISAGPRPAGWSQWRSTCQKEGILFASPYEAGNRCPFRRRVRIVMDVLDDLRRNYHLDTDRTYLSGMSGGARAACAIAFAVPEYFGGVLPVCATGDLRQERWLRHRVIERLSVAYVTGQHDFNRGEAERYRGPMQKAVGVRTRVWVVPGMGHAIPSDGTLGEALAWLEQGLDARRKLAETYPAIRIPADQAPDRRQWSAALLAEAQQRLPSRRTTFSGLVQLKGIMARWPETPAAGRAKQILQRYAGLRQRPWAKTDLDEQRVWRVAEAQALSDYATGSLTGPYAEKRPEWARAAIERWQDILRRNPNAALRKEANERIASLEKLLAGGSPKRD